MNFVAASGVFLCQQYIELLILVVFKNYVFIAWYLLLFLESHNARNGISVQILLLIRVSICFEMLPAYKNGSMYIKQLSWSFSCFVRQGKLHLKTVKTGSVLWEIAFEIFYIRVFVSSTNSIQSSSINFSSNSLFST